jgi:hypothetical protein
MLGDFEKKENQEEESNHMDNHREKDVDTLVVRHHFHTIKSYFLAFQTLGDPGLEFFTQRLHFRVQKYQKIPTYLGGDPY